MDSALREATEEAILEALAQGVSLSKICMRDGMPSRVMVRHWQNADPEFDLSVTRAREDGMEVIAEEALAEATSALIDDPAKARLAFDARRWYVGKLSNAFSDNKIKEVQHSGSMTVITGVPRADD